jgi:hypothetical protein
MHSGWVELNLHGTNYTTELPHGVPDVIGKAVMRTRPARFRLHLPVVFRWKDRLRMKQEQLGYTHDLSVSGLFVLCSAPLPAGTVVDLEVHLPPLEEDKSQCLQLEGTGKVVRVGGPKEPRGFAAKSDFVLHAMED